MANNQILTTASVDNGTNLQTQTEYAADAQRPTGQASGVARSKFINKTLRQLSVVAAGVAQFIADRQGTDVTDSLAPNAFAALLDGALVGRDLAIATGTVDAILLALTPTATALNSGIITWKAIGTNTVTNPTVKRDGLPAKTLVKGVNGPLSAGDVTGLMMSYYDVTLDKEVLLNPATGVNPAPGGYSNLQPFTSSGTFTIPAGVTKIKATLTAGGGGGCNGSAPGNQNNGVGGGGAGGTVTHVLTGLTPGNTITVTVGAGGAAQTSGTNSTLTSGTQTITTVTAVGGTGATGANGATGGGGTGLFVATGGSGGPGVVSFSTNNQNGTGGIGGSSTYGSGGTGSSGSGNGAAGVSYGSGGGGACGLSTTGGTGAPGVVIIEY